MKLVVNQAYENMGLNSTANPGADPRRVDAQHAGRRRFHSARREGGRALVARRDGPFGDYSQAPENERPNPDHVIKI